MNLSLRALTEFVGTFFLVLTIGLTVKAEPLSAAVAIGVALSVLVYMGGHVSGAHYNPAVSLAFLLRKVIGPTEFLAYVVVQLLGAMAGAVMAQALSGTALVVAPSPQAAPFMPVVAEAIWTGLLVLVVLHVATHPKTHGNSYYGVAIGSTVLAGAIAVGPISGGAFNPAVGVGPALVGLLREGASVSTAWVYLVGPLVGAVAAAGLFGLQRRVA